MNDVIIQGVVDEGSNPSISTRKKIEMSATSEIIWEQINQVKLAIEQAKQTGQDVTALMEQYRMLNEQFKVARQTLNESKGVLKG